MARVFLLSPANCGGVRAQMVMRPAAAFDLARRLRSPAGAPLGDVFSFMSGLYFRGKLAYARAFAAPPDPTCPHTGEGVFVITPGAGLIRPSTVVTVADLRRFAGVSIDHDEPRYHRPLTKAGRALANRLGPDCEVVLLGSVASEKYAKVLSPVFGARLKFPPAFVGRGDMSRGGLLLRAAAAGRELDYVSLVGAVVHGSRPPKLAPLRAGARDS
jgi:hypothetical protein